MTETPDEATNPDQPDQDASANKVDADEVDESPTAEKDQAEGADDAAATDDR